MEPLMRALKLQGRVTKVTFRNPALKRFKADGENLLVIKTPETKPSQVWVADITYLKVRNRYAYLITIIDRYSRRIIGWTLRKTRRINDTIALLYRTIKKRNASKGLIFHTDRGIEFTGQWFREALREHDIKRSVNRIGKCTDNAHMESFYHSLKTELIRGSKYDSIKELRCALNNYINRFYNHNRMHSGIEYRSPVEYEGCVA